ncbi:MAG: CPBP family intramembrane glutamic endopeptidase [Bacteroidota bacterium]
MLSGLFEQSSNRAKLVAVIFIMLISIFAFTLIGLLLSLPLFNLDFEGLEILMGDQDYSNISFMKYFQTIISLGTFVFPPFIIAYVFKGEIAKYLSLNKNPYLLSILLVAIAMIMAIPFINFLAEWNSKLSFPEALADIENFMKTTEDDAENLTLAFLKADNIGTLFINLFIIALIPAIGEELLFRGVFQKIFIDWTRNEHVGIWIAAFLFSAVHFQFYGFVPRMLMGAFFGYLLVWSKNMWLPIIAHFVNNAFAVVAYYLMGQSVIGDEAETMGTGDGSFITASISLTLVVFMVYIIFRYEKEKKDLKIEDLEM